MKIIRKKKGMIKENKENKEEKYRLGFDALMIRLR